MSRTDKDMPDWVRADRWEPSHYCRQHASRWRRDRDCDLPRENPRKDPRRLRYARKWRLEFHCTWEPVVPRRWRYSGSHVPKWFVDHVWNNVERRRERDELGRLRREYNANGDLADGDFGCWQPRNYAAWMWD